MREIICRLGQSVVIGDPNSADAAIAELWHDGNLVEVTVVEVREEGERGGHAQVRLGVKASPDVGVHRKEIWVQVQEEDARAVGGEAWV